MYSVRQSKFEIRSFQILSGLIWIDAIRYGWQLIKDHFGDIVLFVVLYIVLGIVMSIILLIVAGSILFVSLVPMFILLIGGGTPGVGAIVFAGVGILLIIVLSSVINTLAIAFRSTTFTLAYLEFTRPAEKTVESIV